METKICPKTWLVESILVTLFCCLPFLAGVVISMIIYGGTIIAILS